MFGYSKAETLGQSPALWHKIGEYPKTRKKILKGLVQRGRWTGEIKFVHKNGTEGICEAVIFPLRDEQGKQIAIIGVSHDITERKHTEIELLQAKEAAEAASRAKSTFLANMSHELRTPLTVMLGYSEMLQDDAKDLGYTDFIPDLQRIQESGKHLLAIINDILDLSKIEAGKMDLMLETFPISDLIEDVIFSVQSLIKKNDNVLQVSSGSDIGTMEGDETKVRQVLFNLLSNAAKFTEQGRITLTVTRQTTCNGLDWIDFQVVDTGIGMSPEEMTPLFQPFVQADTSTSRKYGGTGLGLAISHRLCQLMGGNIEVKSELGKGSTFIVRLPVSIVSDSNQEVWPKPVEMVLTR